MLFGYIQCSHTSVNYKWEEFLMNQYLDSGVRNLMHRLGAPTMFNWCSKWNNWRISVPLDPKKYVQSPMQIQLKTYRRISNYRLMRGVEEKTIFNCHIRVVSFHKLNNELFLFGSKQHSKSYISTHYNFRTRSDKGRLLVQNRPRRESKGVHLIYH